MEPTFIRKVTGSPGPVTAKQLISLLDQDAFVETFVPRSGILRYLEGKRSEKAESPLDMGHRVLLVKGDAYKLIDRLPAQSVNCVVTSPPYWGMRIYDYSHSLKWADGEDAVYGHEQTPEGYIRHTIEILVKLKRVLRDDASIWRNVMDTFNTRTQIRSNAAEALRAMQGKDHSSWADYECRRYSAGHAFLKDGEQCSIPARISERASRIGLCLKTVITWAKTGSMPEPQNSRVSRNLEYVLHLTRQRPPYFQKEAYRTVPPRLGGRNSYEADKLTDVWILSTSSGKDGHGAQFNLALPGRCIALTTQKDDLVLDPFAGGGTSGIAALELGCRFVGFDVSPKYLALAKMQVVVDAGTASGKQRALTFQQELIR